MAAMEETLRRLLQEEVGVKLDAVLKQLANIDERLKKVEERSTQPAPASPLRSPRTPASPQNAVKKVGEISGRLSLHFIFKHKKVAIMDWPISTVLEDVKEAIRLELEKQDPNTQVLAVEVSTVRPKDGIHGEELSGEETIASAGLKDNQLIFVRALRMPAASTKKSMGDRSKRKSSRLSQTHLGMLEKIPSPRSGRNSPRSGRQSPRVLLGKSGATSPAEKRRSVGRSRGSTAPQAVESSPKSQEPRVRKVRAATEERSSEDSDEKEKVPSKKKSEEEAEKEVDGEEEAGKVSSREALRTPEMRRANERVAPLSPLQNYYLTLRGSSCDGMTALTEGDSTKPVPSSLSAPSPCCEAESNAKEAKERSVAGGGDVDDESDADISERTATETPPAEETAEEDSSHLSAVSTATTGSDDEEMQEVEQEEDHVEVEEEDEEEEDEEEAEEEEEGEEEVEEELADLRMTTGVSDLDDALAELSAAAETKQPAYDLSGVLAAALDVRRGGRQRSTLHGDDLQRFQNMSLDTEHLAALADLTEVVDGKQQQQQQQHQTPVTRAPSPPLVASSPSAARDKAENVDKILSRSVSSGFELSSSPKRNILGAKVSTIAPRSLSSSRGGSLTDKTPVNLDVATSPTPAEIKEDRQRRQGRVLGHQSSRLVDVDATIAAVESSPEKETSEEKEKRKKLKLGSNIKDRKRSGSRVAGTSPGRKSASAKKKLKGALKKKKKIGRLRSTSRESGGAEDEEEARRIEEKVSQARAKRKARMSQYSKPGASGGAKKEDLELSVSGVKPDMSRRPLSDRPSRRAKARSTMLESDHPNTKSFNAERPSESLKSSSRHDVDVDSEEVAEMRAQLMRAKEKKEEARRKQKALMRASEIQDDDEEEDEYSDESYDESDDEDESEDEGGLDDSTLRKEMQRMIAKGQEEA